MKKIFTLLFAVGMVTFTSAQSSAFDHGRPGNGYGFNKRQSIVSRNNHGCDVVADRYASHISSRDRNAQFREQQRQRKSAFEHTQFHYQNENRGFSNHDYSYNKKHNW